MQNNVPELNEARDEIMFEQMKNGLSLGLQDSQQVQDTLARIGNFEAETPTLNRDWRTQVFTANLEALIGIIQRFTPQDIQETYAFRTKEEVFIHVTPFVGVKYKHSEFRKLLRQFKLSEGSSGIAYAVSMVASSIYRTVRQKYDARNEVMQPLFVESIYRSVYALVIMNLFEKWEQQ